MELIENRDDIKEILDRIAENEKIPDYTISDVSTNSKGEGFFGNICILTLKSNQRPEKSVNLVLKLAPQDPKIRNSAPIRITYENEIHFYTKIIPEFEKLLQEFSVDEINVAPKCYAASLEEGSEVLVFENLKSDGFVVYDKAKEFDYAHMELTFKSYARYHALSFALKHLKSEKFEELCAEFRNVAASFKQHFGDSMMECRANAIEALIPGEDDAVMAAFKKTDQMDFHDYFHENFKESKYTVILHGDAWSNNMMFKYKFDDNSAKIPLEMRFIDFQMVQKSPPFFDLSYSLYSGGSKEVYDRLDDLLESYYKTSNDVLKKFDIDIEEIFPFSVYKEEWKKTAIVGATISFLIQKLKCTKTQDIVEMGDLVDKGDIQQTNYDKSLYNKHVRDILVHLYEIDAL